MTIRKAQEIIESRLYEALMIPETNLSIFERRPRHRDRMHSILTFQLVSNI